jgi:hypothetical protein
LMSTSMTNPPSPGDVEMGGIVPPQRQRLQLESEQAEDNKAHGSILKLISVVAIFYSGMITVVAQGTRLHCVHWWIPFLLILIVSVAVAIATSCQLKKIPRSPRKVCICTPAALAEIQKHLNVLRASCS